MEIRALSNSCFADCFYQDGMWDEAIKYYKKSEGLWKRIAPPVSDYNQAMAQFKESMSYLQLKDHGQSDPLLRKAIDILHRYPKDFFFCQTEAEMNQMSARLDQQQGNWLGAVEKFVLAGLTKNRIADQGNPPN